MIITENITKQYHRGNTSFNALNNININISDNEHFVSFVGQSGSGKTTLFNILGCLDTPTNGKVFIDGEDINKLPDIDKASL